MKSPVHRSFLALPALLMASVIGWAEPDRHTLSFNAQPTTSWSKDRLIGQLNTDRGGFRILDPSPELGPFDDAELFRVDTALNLPYGRKQLTVRIEVAEGHQPLWDEKLLQFQLNGRELDAALDEAGNPSFEKDIGGDGKGFVPVESGIYRFVLDKSLQDVQFISFMTAGTEQFDATLSDFVIEVWPEEDLRPRSYLLHVNRLGYDKQFRRWAVVEWQEDLLVDSLPVTLRSTQGQRWEYPIERPETPFPGSGRALQTLPFDTHADGFYSWIIPETVTRTRHTTAVLKLDQLQTAYQQHSDQAWQAFAWFDMATYPGTQLQDREALLFEGDGTMDVYGGWFDAGDYGRYSVNGAWSVALPLLSWLIMPEALMDVPEVGQENEPDRPALLSLLKTELDFLASMQAENGSVHHKVASQQWPPLTDAPGDDSRIKYVMPISTTATASVGAVMYMAAEAFRRSPRAKDALIADHYLQVADRAYDFISQTPEMIMIEDRYGAYEYGGPYTDYNDEDERLWLELSRHWVHSAEIEADLFQTLLELAHQPRMGDAVPDWRHVNFLALFTAVSLPDVQPESREQLLDAMSTKFAQKRLQQLAHPFGLMYAGLEDGFDWGSNGVIATVGVQLLWLHHLTGQQQWYEAAFDMSHWFFGLNPHGKIWTTGPSQHQVRSPHFRPLVSGALNAAPGMLSGGPNSGDLKGDMAAQPLAQLAPMRVYVDDRESWATNEVAINWQAAWASYMSLLVSGYPEP